jgi:hypothetical protein
VLQLVAQDHLVQHRVGIAAVERREHARAHGGQVLARAGRVEQLDLAADGPRRLERVVAGREVRAQQRLAREAVHEPQVLVGGDVREIPHERAHDRVDLALEVTRAQVPDEGERPAAHRLQAVHDLSAHERRSLCGPARYALVKRPTGAQPPSSKGG